MVFLLDYLSVIFYNITKKEKNEMFAVYIEDDAGKFNLSNDKTFPTDDYVLDTEKSSCQNGGVLSQDSTTKAVSLSTPKADKCTLYFKKESSIMAISPTYSGELWSQKSNITKVVFENTINTKTSAAYEYDISDTKDGSIKAILVPTDEDSTKYTAYIQANGKIKANKDSSHLFIDFTN